MLKCHHFWRVYAFIIVEKQVLVADTDVSFDERTVDDFKVRETRSTTLRGEFPCSMTKSLDKSLHISGFFSKFAYKLCLTSGKRPCWIVTGKLLIRVSS